MQGLAHGRPPFLQSPCNDHHLFPCMQHVDLRSATGKGRSMPAPVLQRVTAAVSQFVEAVTCGDLDACPLPRITQQQAAEAPPGSLPSRQAAQPSRELKPSGLPEAAVPKLGDGRGAAGGAAPALQPRQLSPQPNYHAHPAKMLQADASWQAAASAPHLAHGAPNQLQGLQQFQPSAIGDREAVRQQKHAADPDAAAPMQLDAPAVQHSSHPQQHVVPADAVKHSSSPDGMAADVATGATAPSDTISSDYDSDNDSGNEQQQQVQQVWQQQQFKQEQLAQHTGMDAEGVLQQGQGNHAMPAMQQMAASALWQRQQPDSAMLMPKAEQHMSQHQPHVPRWQQEPAMPFHDQGFAGRPSLQAPEAMQQPQVGQPAVPASIGQLPLEQIWGQGALSSNVLASLMAGHQQSTPSPNFRDS